MSLRMGDLEQNTRLITGHDLNPLLTFFGRVLNRTKKSRGKEDIVDFKQRFKAFGNLPEFFKLVWETSKKLTLLNIFLRALKSILPLVTLFIGKLIIDEVVHLIRFQPGHGSYNRLFSFVTIEFSLVLLNDLLNRGIALVDSLLGDLLSNRSSVRLMQHAAQLDLDQFEDSAFYDKLELARRQTLNRTILMSQVLGQMQDVITMGFLAIGLISFNPWLILLLIISVVPSFLGESHFNEKTYSLVHSWTPERRELDYLRYTGASDETAKEVKIFGLSDFLIERFKLLSDKYYNENKVLAVKRAGWGVFFSTFGNIGYYIAYIIIILRTVTGHLTLGDLTFLAGSFSRLKVLLEGVLNRFTSIAEAALYLGDFFDFFRLEPRIKVKENPRKFPHPILKGFRFENVSFRYQNTDKWAIRNVSFTLNAREKLALVGENGAGKTTLVKLLARLYDPTEGRIFLDDHDLKEFDPEDLRKEIGVIFQDFVKFQMTASNNIAVGRIEEKENYEKIRQSALRSLADSVIEKLPNGYQQMIGRRFSDGIDLSGGQWQKMALGRAYMRDAQLLILDEPTAALDARAEYEVFQRFADLTKGKTVILISHRFSTVRMADRILVLENGKCTELGTHNELLEKGGTYSDLFNLQAQGYR
ncbi:MAG: ABC transporter ATP-binding protein [Bacteroidota bacterium]|nr:ABC transporter ATP-binding protein [Bacteroidota bacterium]